MLESLGNIQNPILKSLTAAATIGSVMVLATSIALGVKNPKDDSAYQTALSASLLGAGCGAVFGLAYRPSRKTTGAIVEGEFFPASQEGTWKDWRNFVVVRKVKESEEITSFYLQPKDQGSIPGFLPGQFLTIKLDVPGQTRPVIRTYSLSDYCEPCTYYRLSIKREPTPQGLEVPPGIASNFMHDKVQEGSILQAKPPSGKFVLEVADSVPAVLVSNGVGITPMISMAKALNRLNPRRTAWFLHGARDGQFHAFREEVQTIAAQNSNLQVHIAYSRPREEDTGHYHSTGYVDAQLIHSLKIQNADYFLCGSAPFIESLREGLKQAEVPENRVFFEMFTKAKTSDRPMIESGHVDPGKGEVVFAQSGQTLSWQSDAENLLEFAEAHDLNPPYSCRQGICGTCQCRLLAGEVEYLESPTAEVDPGSVLICIAKPKTPRVVLDL
ncbi:MAG: 2Fe-2S iron-sulfur cluster-binding protein [Leptolyngbyaceae cyanobacterium bins.302]|nr:2Fe-2S iron-sulfur cluster-binding protein [Leptolyngbyaceae cyanobacterium bins.302]